MAEAGKVIPPYLKKYKLAELKHATGNFRSDMILGEGGFGRVFKGWVDERTLAPTEVGSGILVAIKKSNPDSNQGLREWLSEVKFLGKFSHPNLVRLLGYCWEDNHLLLVYEYMPRGSLENHLFRKIIHRRNFSNAGGAEPLPWEVRLKIAIGAARALDFLHAPENNVIYRDFKSSNILLDADYNANLSDFGLATPGPAGGNSHVTMRGIKTDGYAAHEYIATRKTEIPSFFSGGIVGSVRTTLFKRLRDYLARLLRDGHTTASVHQNRLDFGLRPADGKSHVSTRVIGTHGYAAPQYIATGKTDPIFLLNGQCWVGDNYVL
ncbi:hypothetical protein BT93_F2947 [Corymbia citriodora subsp. variegata]|nr:hypothetical protein BT93_F2947 [Corymbia citriodora subsp. variegata]